MVRALGAHGQSRRYRSKRSSPEMSGAPLDATAYRVLCRSKGLNDQPIATSGVVIIPAGTVPPAGKPIIAWAHPTTGIVPHCAPSLAIFFFQQVQGLREMVRRGYIVASTDYPGLGTPGPHPYLVGVAKAAPSWIPFAQRAIWRKAKRKSALRSGATRKAVKPSFMHPSSRRAMPLILNYQESRQRRRPRTWEPLCAPISPRREARTYSP